LPALAVYLGKEEKTTEKGKIENRIVYFRKKKKTQKKLKQGGIFKKQKHTEKGKTEKGWYF
jgi:hypothetical protein